MQCFLRLAGFFEAAAGTAEEQAKNFQWGLRRSTLNHLMYMPFTDVAQVANVARNYEILHERDDDEAERPDKRLESGDRHQPTTQQSSHRNHDARVMGEQREVLDSMDHDLSRFTTWTVTSLSLMMDRSRVRLSSSIASTSGVTISATSKLTTSES
nr:hypothetical protein [Tanacetum cinerariifolium]